MCLGEEDSVASHFTPDRAAGAADRRRGRSSAGIFTDSALMHFEAQGLQIPVLIKKKTPVEPVSSAVFIVHPYSETPATPVSPLAVGVDEMCIEMLTITSVFCNVDFFIASMC